MDSRIPCDLHSGISANLTSMERRLEGVEKICETTKSELQKGFGEIKLELRGLTQNGVNKRAGWSLLTQILVAVIGLVATALAAYIGMHGAVASAIAAVANP